MLYTFLDPIIFKAYSVSHLSADQFPPLADYDYAKNLVKRSFKVSIRDAIYQLGLILIYQASGPILRRQNPTSILWANESILYVIWYIDVSWASCDFDTNSVDKEYIGITLMSIIRVVTMYASPIGINRLLE